MYASICSSKVTRMSAQNNNKRAKQALAANQIGVIVCGYPGQAAVDVAKACAKRGYKVRPFGLALADVKDLKIIVPDVGTVQLVKFGDASAKAKLQEAIQAAEKEGLSVVVADTTEVAGNASVYNEVKVPFVLQSKGGEVHDQLVKQTEDANTFALISQQMNKRLAAFDQMWQEWGKRYPGLFDDHDFSFKSSHPGDTPKSLLDSFSDLTNQSFGLDKVQMFGKDDKFTEGHATREYTFKNGSGSSSFVFRQSVKTDAADYAESVADSVGFLAQKAQEIARPQVYNILDVAAAPRLLM